MSDSFIYNPPKEPWLSILYQDKDFLVVDKPSGLLSVPGRIHKDSVLSRVLEIEERAYAVHRLDMDTSGLLVIALRRKAEKALMEEFRLRRVQKEYVAIVSGTLSQIRGVISAPLSRCLGSPPRSEIDWENGKAAYTEYKVLHQSDTKAYVQLFPKTGRSHQLRVHLLHLGHPILGDRFYFPESQEKRLMLHAKRLIFAHPYHGKRMEFFSNEGFKV
ncbi:MAG: RNA pseudouridine synthase [Deltaproteobacteria bacterium]|nr:RNA pseudouridine synthase [Deltaproteobacteria bacterium]